MTEEPDTVEQNTEATAKKLHATREDANAAKPANAPERIKLFEVLHHGQSRGFVWTDGHAGAIVAAAREDGYTATLAEKKAAGPITKERVAAKLAEFTDAELAAMGLSRKKGKKQLPAGHA
jgi:hypothetical protein